MYMSFNYFLYKISEKITIPSGALFKIPVKHFAASDLV